MRLRHAIIGIGVVVAAGASAAQAEETKAVPHALKAADDNAWFERFTASTAGEAVRAAPLAERSMTWAPSARWGVTLNLKDTDRTKTSATRDETALGAFYDFTPRLRFGGEVRVADPTATNSGAGAKNNANPDATAGVKLESAFRF